MSTPKTSSWFSLAGPAGIVSILIGTSQKAEYLLDVSFICLALGGLLRVPLRPWVDFTFSGTKVVLSGEPKLVPDRHERIGELIDEPVVVVRRGRNP